MLKDADFKLVYSTGEDEPIEFYIEALMESKQLDLGLGFFSTSGFKVLNYGFAYFISQGGKMRLIINNVLTQQDKDAIEKGQNSNFLEIIEDRLVADFKAIQQTLSKQDKHFFNCISWLIAKNKLSIVSIAPNDGKGIAHQKFGVFSDSNSDKVAFTGSLNFSESAFIYNLETVSCYRSWTKEKERVDYYNGLFRNIWTGQNSRIVFIPIEKIRTAITSQFPDPDIDDLLKTELELINQQLEDSPSSLVQKKLQRLRKRVLGRNTKLTLKDSSSSELCARPYQQDAIDRWVKSNYQGFFEMATGTGKTYTALFASLTLKERLGKCFLLVLVPTISLAQQWKEEVRKVGFRSIVNVSSLEPKWSEQLTQAFNSFKLNTIDHGVCISTYDSYKSSSFQSTLSKFPVETLLIADEAHTMGAFQMLQKLPFNIEKRLGLSATPHRHFDDLGTTKLLEFFNARDTPTYKLDLSQAIAEQFLCQYKLYPHLVELDQKEYESYIDLTKKIAKCAHINKNQFEGSNPRLEKLLRDRRNILNRASGKLKILGEIIDGIKEDEGSVSHTLVYCPEGADPEENEKIIDIYGKFLGLEKDLSIGKFTGETPADERQQLLTDFDNGKIQCLLAMKCLDEGVDVKQTKIAIFLASSTNPRQYIQRRGRILRTHPKKSFAFVHDILAIPPDVPAEERLLDVEKIIIGQELRRYKEFASDALNYVEAVEPIKPITDKYELTI
jgi:superfamily II DNA or RNA helicase